MRISGLVSAGIFALALPLMASADCEVTIDSDDRMQFDKDEITVSRDCDEVTLTLTHSGDLAVEQMGHNWVLTLADDLDGVAQDGMAAGIDNEHIEPGDERVIAATDLIGGGEETSITFSIADLDPDEHYKFVCTFPGHPSMMRGDFIIE